MENTFSILIWINKSKLNNKKAPLFGRITVNGKRAEISLKISIEPEKWDSKKSYVKGNKEEARIYNVAIDNFLLKVRRIYENCVLNRNIVTAEIIKNNYFGKAEDNYYILEIFREFISEIERRIGKDYSKKTVERYTTTYNSLNKYILYTYNIKDVNLKELNYSFISKYESFLKIENNNKQNTIYHNVKQLKTVIGIALKKELIDKNPFSSYKVKSEQGERGFLTQEELEKIETIVLKDKKLELIRDYFIFSCYTGIAYIDLYNLTNDDISIGIDGDKWILSHRQKSSSKFMIPLLPEALKIIEKYKRIKDKNSQNKLFFIFSNQQTNNCLKEIADICGIKKNLTFHIARHTFATTVTLTNGVPIETVSKMLGHKNIKTTQIYSKVVEQKVSQDMKALKEKLLNINSKNTIKKIL